MGIETYIVIAACYGLGCYMSYRLGRSHGLDEGINYTLKRAVNALMSKSNMTLDQAKEFLKSKGS